MTPPPPDPHDRTRLLVGDNGLLRLSEARVAVFGLGGVGGYAAEAVVRSGVGTVVLVDHDTVEATNLNRQLLALHSTLGLTKVDVALARCRDINPSAKLVGAKLFAEEGNLDGLLSEAPHVVIDAIDTVSAKVALLARAHELGHHVIACMGAADKLSPLGIEVADLAKTHHCPLARVVRQRLRERGITSGITCVFTPERQGATRPAAEAHRPPEGKQRVQGSISYVPGLVGLTAAGLAIGHILAGAESPGH